MNIFAEGPAMTAFPRSLPEFQRRFADEAACVEYLAAARWPEGFACPACGGAKAWQLWTKPFTGECASCGKQTSVAAGTVMHGSNLDLTVWFWAAYLMATDSNGISATQLQMQLGLGSYKTAWLQCGKLCRAMVDTGRNPLTGRVEVDETTIPFRTKEDPVAGGGGRSPEGKMPVIAAVEIVGDGPGRLRLAPIADYSAESIRAFVANNIACGARLKTVEWASYPGTPKVDHDPHVIGNMAAHVVLPWTHRVFANLKRWALGVYHGLRRNHLQSYLDEFVFRFNRRRTRHAAFRSLLRIAAQTRPPHLQNVDLTSPLTKSILSYFGTTYS
jgi:hypothetical protein